MKTYLLMLVKEHQLQQKEMEVFKKLAQLEKEQEKLRAELRRIAEQKQTLRNERTPHLHVYIPVYREESQKEKGAEKI
jgi:hypothetical protein